MAGSALAAGPPRGWAHLDRKRRWVRSTRSRSGSAVRPSSPRIRWIVLEIPLFVYRVPAANISETTWRIVNVFKPSRLLSRAMAASTSSGRSTPPASDVRSAAAGR